MLHKEVLMLPRRNTPVRAWCSVLLRKKCASFVITNQPAKDADSWHRAMTFELDARVRKCALKLQDQHLLAKFSAGDLIAQKVKYHVQCLVSLYNKARQKNVQVSDEMEATTLINQGIALAELVSYIEDARTDTEAVRVFKLADLTRMYTTRLEQLGTSISWCVHSTDFRNRLLSYFPDLQLTKKAVMSFLLLMRMLDQHWGRHVTMMLTMLLFILHGLPT